jgi:hypothetical protein
MALDIDQTIGNEGIVTLTDLSQTWCCAMALFMPMRRSRLATFPRCPYRKLYPAVFVMKPTKDRPRGKLTVPLDWPMALRILGQRQMCAEPVVIGSIGSKDSAQMGAAEDDDVIEAFPADRADQSLRMPVLAGDRGAIG